MYWVYFTRGRRGRDHVEVRFTTLPM